MRRRTAKQQPVFKEWTYKNRLHHHEYKGFQLSANSFAAACGGNCIYELETFIVSVKSRHPERMLYLLTDEEGKKECERVIKKHKLDSSKVTIWTVDDRYKKKVEAKCKKVMQHSSYWSSFWIYAKLDAFRMAIEDSKSGVMLLDSDIILNDRIDESFNADLVLSAHTQSFPLKPNHETYGFFNAGMAICNRVAVINDWINKFTAAGAGSFYEQKCMEDLSKSWVIDVISENHNFGKWRRESLEFSRRKVRSFHLHLNEKVLYPEQPFNIKKAKEANDDNFAISKLRNEGKNKFAFVHISRNAGTFIREYLRYRQNIPTRRQIQILDSWILHLEREWTDDELVLIANNRLWGQKGDRFFVHNHQWGWTERAFKEMKRNGFISFTFMRPVRDVLASCWFYYEKHKENGSIIWEHESYDSSAIEKASNINEGIQALVSNVDLIKYWSLPGWIKELDLIYKWSESNFASFLDEYFAIEYSPIEKINSTSNPGWDYLVESGVISDDTIDAVDTSKEVREWERVYQSAIG